MPTTLSGNIRKLNKSTRGIIGAFEKGYRVDSLGTLTSPKGKVLPVKLRSNHRYPQTVVVVNGERINLHIHRLAAYCFYGEESLIAGICVRHLNGDVLDISRENIALGTYSENERDKPPELRSKNARNANLKRKDTRRLSMRRFNREEILDIKSRLRDGETGASIARYYGVANDTLYQIRDGETYKDIELANDADELSWN